MAASSQERVAAVTGGAGGIGADVVTAGASGIGAGGAGAASATGAASVCGATGAAGATRDRAGGAVVKIGCAQTAFVAATKAAPNRTALNPVHERKRIKWNRTN